MKTGRYKIQQHLGKSEGDNRNAGGENFAAEMELNIRRDAPLPSSNVVTLTGSAKDGEAAFKGMSLIHQKKLRSLKRIESSPGLSVKSENSPAQKKAADEINPGKMFASAPKPGESKALHRKSESDLTLLAFSAANANLSKHSMDILSEAEKLAQNSNKNFIAAHPFENKNIKNLKGTQSVSSTSSKSRPITNPHIQQYLQNFYLQQQQLQEIQNYENERISNTRSPSESHQRQNSSQTGNQFISDTLSCLSASSGYSSSSNSSNSGSLRSNSALSMSRYSEYIVGEKMATVLSNPTNDFPFLPNLLLDRNANIKGFKKSFPASPDVPSSPDSSISAHQRMSSSDEYDTVAPLPRKMLSENNLYNTNEVVQNKSLNRNVLVENSTYCLPAHTSKMDQSYFNKISSETLNSRSHEGIASRKLEFTDSLSNELIIGARNFEKDPVMFDDVDQPNTILIPPLESSRATVEQILFHETAEVLERSNELAEGNVHRMDSAGRFYEHSHPYDSQSSLQQCISGGSVCCSSENRKLTCNKLVSEYSGRHHLNGGTLSGGVVRTNHESININLFGGTASDINDSEGGKVNPVPQIQITLPAHMFYNVPNSAHLSKNGDSKSSEASIIRSSEANKTCKCSQNQCLDRYESIHNSDLLPSSNSAEAHRNLDLNGWPPDSSSISSLHSNIPSEKHLDPEACQNFFRTRYSKTKIFWRRNLQEDRNQNILNKTVNRSHKAEIPANDVPSNSLYSHSGPASTNPRPCAGQHSEKGSNDKTVANDDIVNLLVQKSSQHQQKEIYSKESVSSSDEMSTKINPCQSSRENYSEQETPEVLSPTDCKAKEKLDNSVPISTTDTASEEKESNLVISEPISSGDISPKLSRNTRLKIIEEFDSSSESLNLKMVILRKEIVSMISKMLKKCIGLQSLIIL